MANVSKNLLVHGARGNVGKQFVYKKRGNDTHIAKMPEINKNLVATADQTRTRDLFAAAASYARGVVTSPALKKEYQKKAAPGRTAYNIALRDYLKAPVVKSIDATAYNGAAGSVIAVFAKDDFRVADVTVSIRTAAGELVEQGLAVLDSVDRNKWNYTATQANPVLAGSVISAMARDLPGNKAVLESTV